MNVWVIGSGLMAESYNTVLSDLGYDYQMIGRGHESAVLFEQHTGRKVIIGGVKEYLKSGTVLPSHAIITTGVEALSDTCRELILAGVRSILVEKPAGLNKEEIISLNALAQKHNASVFVAYNRRFYSSVLRSSEIIANDGGATSFNFEFTEWSHVIEPLKKAAGVKEHFFLANSTHVVDLAFFLGGKPQKITSFTSGSLSWHPRSAIFSGAGISETGALFSYQANWCAPGRWGVEILTNKHRLILRPLEQLQIQKIGSISIEPVEIDDSLDIKYKPGIFNQVVAFLHNDHSRLCSLEEQASMMPTYYEMSGY